VQVQHFRDDQRDEHLVEVDAVAAEHAPCPHRAGAAEQFKAVGGEFVGR